MGVFNYIVKKHPAGFKGFRVVVNVNGKIHQKYFACAGFSDDEIQDQHERAKKLNAQWIAKKEREAKKRENAAIPYPRTTPHSTGIRGITIREYKDGRKPNYVVQVYWIDRYHRKHFPLTANGWVDAVRFFAKAKEIKKWKHLLTRRETVT